MVSPRCKRVALLLLALTAVPGCQAIGPLLYHAGLGPRERIPAEFKLPPGPLVILVDDYLDVVQPPLARHELVDVVTRELRDQKLVDRVTTNEELGRLRQSEPDFENMSIREVGRLVNADTMIWIQPQQYRVNADLELAHTEGVFSARVKVFNIREDDSTRIRLWPPERDGRLVSATLSPHDIRASRSPAEVHRKMADALGDTIAKLFYEYTIER